MTLIDTQGRTIAIGNVTCSDITSLPQSFNVGTNVYRYYSDITSNNWSGSGTPVNSTFGIFESSTINILEIKENTGGTAQISGVSYMGTTIDSSSAAHGGQNGIAIVSFTNEYGNWCGICFPDASTSHLWLKISFAVPQEDFVEFVKQTSVDGEGDRYGGSGGTNDPWAGLTGSGDFTGDQVRPDPSERFGTNKLIPFKDAAHNNSYGYHAYAINSAALDDLAIFLYGGIQNITEEATSNAEETAIDKITNLAGTFWNKFKDQAFNPMESIIALHVIPRQLILDDNGAIGGGVTALRLAGASIPIQTGSGGGSLAYCLNKTQTYWTTYERDIEETFGDFNDYRDVSVKVYVPFCGSIDVPPSSCINGSLRVEYLCDLPTGDCEARVVATDRRGNQNIVGVLEGNCATSIPISHSYDNFFKQLSGAASGAIQAISGAMTGSIPLVLSGALKTNPLLLASQYEQHTTVSGNLSSRGSVGYLVPYIEITQNIPIHASGEEDIRGIQNYYGGTVDKGLLKVNDVESEIKYSGFTRFQSVDVSGVSKATSAQKEEIERLLLEGVYIERGV